MTWAEFLAYWGAGIATILGAVRVWEFLSDRRQLRTAYSSMDREITIVVSSIGKKPVFVFHYFLYRRSSRGFGKKKDIVMTLPDDEIVNRSVSIDKPLILTFSEQNYFPMYSKNMRKAKLFLALKISAKRSPIILNVYP